MKSILNLGIDSPWETYLLSKQSYLKFQIIAI